MADEQMKDNNQEESENRTTELMGIDSKIMKVKSYDGWGGEAVGWEKNIDFFSHQLVQYISRGRCKMRNSILGEGLGINEAKK